MLIAASAVLWFSGLPALAYFYAVMAVSADTARPALQLGDYEAKIEARPVEGLTRDLSGLTYSPQTGTLFAIVNRPAQIAELSVEGRLLRTIVLNGVQDPEGLTHVEGGRFIVTSERHQSLHWITVDRSTSQVTAEGGDRLRLDFGALRNMGFEGLSWDSRQKRLYIAQEMLPARVLVVDGLASTSTSLNLAVSEWSPHGLAATFMLDLSSLSLHESTGNLILLSHLSRILVEYAPDGRVLSFLPLWRGMNGLSASIAQAEGVAIGPDGDVFIVAEPNLFYRFGKHSDAAEGF
ncbi:hypothetical protein ASE36_14720 [Rhizobium sp. Root274]|uniref:SdiA-regulated domain-containing protein n=1 Tax=Rhizobium sp. Root1240 TaxID=1736437 RepID=UPI0007149E41|nr:SdiA-regulated domain-containing protein [Rhizobium sp. Root1240]KQW29660.1 hypothetical protein ASC71_14745 [Rhizobium sp. Root1240]KRD29850.1 hypothetical protein ASE36_14720 [Rhizobium sp. Root274]